MRRLRRRRFGFVATTIATLYASLWATALALAIGLIIALTIAGPASAPAAGSAGAADGSRALPASQVSAAPWAPALAASHRVLTAGSIGDPTWLPAIIFNDGPENASFAVLITGGSFDAVYLTTEGVLTADADLSEGVRLLSEDLIRLYDDGTHGDAAAGDGVHSRAGITAPGALSHDGGTHQRLANKLLFFAEHTNGTVQSSMVSLETGLSIVDVSQRGTVAVTTLAPNLTATSHALFLVDDGTVFPNYPQVDAGSALALCRGCEILITEFGDVFDFIVLQVREVVDEPLRGVRQAVFSNIFNDVLGIGIEQRDLNVGPDTFVDGTPFNTYSQGRLQGIIFDNRVDGAPLSHEVMHRWSAHAAAALGWLDGEGHFVANSDINGMMDLQLQESGGSLVKREDAPFLPVDLVANGDGTYHLEARPGEFLGTFAPISLYVAGFIPASQVPRMRILGGTIDLSNPDRVTATSVTEITVEDVIGLEGPRVSASATAPRDFTVGTIVISDRPYAEADYTFITLALRYWESDKPYDGFGAPPWKTATLGQSEVRVALPASMVPDAGGEPEPMLPGAAESRSARLRSGWNFVAWSGESTPVEDAIGAITPTGAARLTFFT